MSAYSQVNSNSNSTARIEVIGGQPVVFVGERMFALPAVNTASATMPYGDPPAMDPAAKPNPDLDVSVSHDGPSGVPFGPPRANTVTPLLGLDLPTLRAQQTLKKQELRTVEQTEVLQASHKSDAWRAGMIEKKRCLIVELDALRKQVTALEGDTTSVQSNFFLGSVSTGSTSMPPFPLTFQQPPSQTGYPFSSTNPYATMMMYPPQPFSGFSNFPAVESAPFVPAATNPTHSPGSASRRSHAIEIKPPREDTKMHPASALDPKSPTYEPATKPSCAQDTTSPTPSPPKRSPGPLPGLSKHAQHVPRAVLQRLSLSSIDTTDFFPTNTHEHSTTRVAPRAKDARPSSNEDTAIPSTPEKHWPASPWNEGDSVRSRKHEAASKLASWPETFGKQPSLPSVPQGTGDSAFSAMLEQANLMNTNIASSVSSNYVVPRTKSDQRTGTEENWPFSSKAVAHVPSTYQEGYQAGYDHVGIPDSPEVLQGYIQGLLHFLSDEAKKRQVESSARGMYARGFDTRTPSLRGLVAGSTPHDSAVSMSFNHNQVPNASQENVRTAKDNFSAGMRHGSAYSPQGNVREGVGQHGIHNEVVQEPRQRVVSVARYPNPARLFSESNMSVHGQTPYAMAENNGGGGFQGKDALSETESILKGAMPQPQFGDQMQNRGYGTPLMMQRFYPTPRELSPRGFGGDKVSPVRPFGDYRLSGLDGAMDDLAEMMNDTHVNGSSTREGGLAEEAVVGEVEEVDASCFKSSSSMGKQKATVSPTKATPTGRDKTASSPAMAAGSPKKSGEHSPAKAKLEQVTNKFRRVKKDDPRAMSSEDRMKRSEKWRQRFQQLKRMEIEEIEAQRRNTRS